MAPEGLMNGMPAHAPSPCRPQVIPRSVKMATVVGMGLLIALIGMVSIELVVPNTEVRHRDA